MPSYKFTYFPVRARGEPIRLIFAQAGVKFENIRVPFDEWKPLKASGKCPFGQLPILETDGKILSQSSAITRYVAEQVGLLPSTAADRAQADAIIEACKELLEKFGKIYWEKDQTKKEEMKKEMFETTLPKQLGYFENILKSNKEGKGYFVGDKLTYADITFFNLCNSNLAQGEAEVPDELKGNNLLLDHYKRVMAEPNILNWIKTRDESAF